MSKRCISNECLETTGFSYTLSLINGKYKMTILYTLMEFGVVRFNEMKKYISEISYKTLSSTLKELEADQLVHRKEYPQIPPKVEYSLTERGKSLYPPFYRVPPQTRPDARLLMGHSVGLGHGVPDIRKSKG